MASDAARADALVGYAFPTHEGPGVEKGMPERERPTIENLAREAVAANTIRTFRFEGPHDAVLFVAVPIHEQSSGTRTNGPTEEVTGAAWLMERLPGIEGGKSRQLLFGSIGFGMAALMTALLAVFVTTEIRSGVNIVLQRLGSMEGGLPAVTQQTAGRPPLEEFDRVLHGIDSLALAFGRRSRTSGHWSLRSATTNDSLHWDSLLPVSRMSYAIRSAPSGCERKCGSAPPIRKRPSGAAR